MNGFSNEHQMTGLIGKETILSLRAHSDFSPISSLCKKILAGLGSRTSGPGGFHNIGNLTALFGGYIVFCLSSETQQNETSTLWAYLFGSVETSCLTLSMLIFMAGGEAYHRGCGDQKRKNPNLIRLGDLLSGIATVVLAFALVQIGEARLALIAGCMLAASKFGTAILPEQPNADGAIPIGSRILRTMAIISRIPSLAAVSATLITHAISGGDTTDTLLALIMLISYLLWLTGDCLLIAPSKKFREILKVPSGLITPHSRTFVLTGCEWHKNPIG